MAKLLILGSYHGGASCTEFARAAANLGHEVIRCGPRFTEADAARWAETIRGMEWVTEGEAERYVQEVLAASPVPEIETDVGERVWHQDLPAHDAQIDFWQYGETPVVEWGDDEEPSDRPQDALVLGDTHTGYLVQQQGLAVTYDHLFLQFRPADLAAFDHPSKHWLPPAADPQVWVCAEALPFPKTWDVCLVASTDREVHRERVALVEHLRAQGLDVHVEHSFGHRAAFAFNQSKVVLNRSLAGDVNLRVVEALMTGALLVTDEVDGLEGMKLLDDRGLFTYRTPEEAARAIRHALGEPGWAVHVARRGRDVVLARHTWEHRVREVLDVMGVEQNDGERGGRGGGGCGGVAAVEARERVAAAERGRAEGLAPPPGVALVSIVIPAYGHQDLTYRLAESVVSGGREVLVVDDASPDEFPPPPEGVRLYTTARNGGFAAACNAGAREAQGDVLVFMNNDCEPEAGWLAPLVEEARTSGGIAGALILNPDGSVQAAGLCQLSDGEWVNATWDYDAGHSPVDVSAVMGACFAVRRDVFWKLGGLDEGFPSGCEDVDLCLRAKAQGRPVRLVPAARVRHREGTTRMHLPDSQERIAMSQQRLRERWGGLGDQGQTGLVPWRHGASVAFSGPLSAEVGGSIGVINGALARHLTPDVLAGCGRVAIVHYWPGPDASWELPAEADHVFIIAPWEQGAPPEAWKAVLEHPRFRCLFTPSKYSRGLFLSGGWPDNKVRVVPNGVDTAVFTPDGPTWKARTPGVFRVLFVGGLLERKGIRELYAAWDVAFGPDENVRLTLKAQGSDSFYRGQQVLPPSDLANVQLLDDDTLTAEEMAALYRSHDLVCQPYRAEGFCLPLLEAMACGVPVLYPSYGPALEYVPPQARGVVPEYRGGADALHLALALRRLRESPRMRQELGLAGWQAALEYAWGHIATRYARAIKRAIKEVCGG